MNDNKKEREAQWVDTPMFGSIDVSIYIHPLVTEGWLLRMSRSHSLSSVEKEVSSVTPSKTKKKSTTPPTQSKRGNTAQNSSSKSTKRKETKANGKR